MDSSQLTFGVAFLAGLASFLSPCVLPLVPIYLAQLVGQGIYQSVGDGEERAGRFITFLHALSFMLEGFCAPTSFCCGRSGALPLSLLACT